METRMRRRERLVQEELAGRRQSLLVGNMGRRERLVQEVGGLLQKVFDLKRQLESMETEVASIESEIASIDADIAETRGVSDKAYVMTSIGRRKAMEMPGSYSKPLHWDLYAPMKPALWSALPIEIQRLVFARLPWLDVIKLRCVSKQWKRCVSSEDSEFMRLCTEANPRMFAMINRIVTDWVGTISVRMYDTKRDRWHHFIDRVVHGHESSWTMCAGDGGLVCFVTPPRRENMKTDPLVITVCNPLTREQVKLPSNDLCSVRPRMVQLVMDRERKCYKVIVVDEEKRRGDFDVAQIYSSETRSWSSATACADLIFGRWFAWRYDDFEYLYEQNHGPCAYDCAKGQLLMVNNSEVPWTDAPKVCYAL